MVTEQPARVISGASIVAVGMMVMNVTLYGFTIVAARMLQPREFGAFTALLGVILIGNVIALGLQTVVARRLATAAENQDPFIKQSRTNAFRFAFGISAIVAISSLFLTTYLRLDSYLPVALAALALIPLTIMGVQMGIAQGEHKWSALAIIYLANGFGRFAGGLIALLISPTATSAMVGIAIGNWLPVIFGSRLFKTKHHTEYEPPPMFREVIVGSNVLFAYFALTSVDSLIARNQFPADDAGLYAAGLILTKAALFFPQFVTVVAFPNMAREETGGTKKKAVLLVAGFGFAITLGTWLLPQLALALVGGAAYSDVADQLWMFALSGSSLAVLHLLVFDALARHAPRIPRILWTGLGALIISALLLDVHLTGLVTLVITIALGLSVVLYFAPQKSVRGVEPVGTDTN